MELHAAYGLHDGPKWLRLDSKYTQYKPMLLPAMLPIAEDSSGNQFCLALAGRLAGRVFLWDHESQDEEQRMEFYQPISDSFAAFLAASVLE